MVLWNYCAICGERIEAGKPCIGIKENTELCGDSICFACAKIENLPDGKDTMTITDLLARAEAAEARADEAEASLAAAVRDMEAMAATIRVRSIYDTECCFLCKYDGPVEDYCPGWEGEECFRWRGT